MKRGDELPRFSTYQPQPVDLVAKNDNDGNESVDSLDVFLERRNNSPDDRATFEAMKKALRGVEEVLNTNTIHRRSPSLDDSMRSDVGKFMDMPSRPDPVTRYSAGENKHAGGDANHLAMAKSHALSVGIEYGDKLTGSSMQDSPSRFDDDNDYDVANMVADTQRGRSTKRMQQRYRHLEDREGDGESTTLHIDDEMDSSTSSGTCYSDGEGEDCTLGLGELCGVFEKQRQICIGNVRDEIIKYNDRKRRSHNKKNRRKRSTRREGSASKDSVGFTREDATLGDTVISGYTREDSTLTETIMSGSTEYEMAVLERPPLLAEPNYLAEDDYGKEDESTSNKVFYLIHNICSGPCFRSNDNDKQSSQSEVAKVIEGEANAKESDVVAYSVKEHLDRTRSKQSDVAAVNNLKKSESLNKSMGMASTALIRKPTQSELKAIYESSCRSQTNSNVAPSRTDDDADTVEMGNQQRTELNRVGCDESAKPATDRKKKSLRHILFSFKSKKTGRLKFTAPSTDDSATPVSPARTVATGTSDISIESTRDEDDDDDVFASYAALAMTRTKSKILIEI